jgi:hypothetical protein
MILTLKKADSLNGIYLLTLDRWIEYRRNEDDVLPIDIINFLKNHYSGKFKECENYEFTEVDQRKLDRYISNIEKSHTVEEEWSVGVGTSNDDFYKNREIINILVNLETGEEKSFITTLKMYMGDKNLSYNVDF